VVGVRAIVMLALVVAVIGFSVGKFRAEPTAGSCVGAHGPIGWADCLPDPESPMVEELTLDTGGDLPPCSDPTRRLEDARWADLGGATLTCP
jgi:hypothetical protein